jgi:predicted dehydrogenase
MDQLIDACDALSVVVPTPAHHGVARPALERGRHLLIEKPIATSLDEADEMLALAERHGALVQTGHVERFNRAIRAALPYVDSPRFIESDRLAPFNPRGADVAVVLDLMIHDIDLVHTLVGGHAASVSAVGVPVLTPFVDIANARLTFDSGAVANITASRVSRERMRKLRIFQQSGYLSLDLGSGVGEFYRLRGDVDVAALAAAPLALEQFVERIPLRAEEGEPLRLEFGSFLAAVRGEVPVAVSGEAGREALAVALQIVADIERSLPSLSGRVPAGARA